MNEDDFPHSSTATQLVDENYVLERELDTARTRIDRLETALKKLTLGWLYWPAKRQPDPRVTMYESQTLDAIEKMAKEALGG